VSVDALRAYVEELLAVYGFPGLAVAITDGDGLVASEAFGLANVDAGVPVDRGTYFEFGSIGKVFTTVLILQLREEGLIDLDEPLASYLPWFEVGSEHAPITIRHVLTHSSGLMVGADVSANSRYDVWALRDCEVGFPPGSEYLYSNVGFRTLGFVVEDLTGMRYAEAIRTRVLLPLDLHAVDPEITSDGRHRLAVAYERLHDDRPPRRADPWIPAPWVETGTGDGAQAGTVEDLAGFLRMLLKRGEGLISRESFELMTTPAIEADDGWWYGCGLELRERRGRREIRHGGSMPGFGATMLGDLDSGLGVTIAVNATDEHDRLEEAADAVLDFFREGAAPFVPDPLAIDEPAEFSGVYVGEAGRLTVVADGDRLVLDGTPLEPRGTDRFFADRPDLALYHLAFHRENDRVVAAKHGGDVYPREGVDLGPVPSTPPEWSTYPGHYRAYNPWYSNFRIVLRRGELIQIFPRGMELKLEPLADGSFRAGDESSPERLRFDAVVDGQALCVDAVGEKYYRVP
jgi:D-alanyl-D-alanine carboxypeptidase